jgi:pimeloyl-ACP methyl ester carboxylesterase
MFGKVEKRMKKALRIAAWLIVILLFIPVAGLGWFWLSGRLRQTQNHADVAPRTGRFLEIGDTRLYIQELGPENGEPIVFIHGTVAWSGTWRPTMEALASQGYRCIAIDMPPFGFSTRPFRDDYSRDTQGRRIELVAEALNLQGLTLVGHSFGARATLTAAARMARTRMRRLVLVAAATGFTQSEGPDQPEVSPAVASILSTPPLRAAIGSVFVHPSLTRTGLEFFSHNKAAITEGVLLTYQAPLKLESKSASTGLWLLDFLTNPRASVPSQDPVWGELTMPVLLLWGDHDKTTPVWQAEKIKGLVKQASLVVLKDIGHLPQIEAPGEFQEAISNFMKEAAGGRSSAGP